MVFLRAPFNCLSVYRTPDSQEESPLIIPPFKGKRFDFREFRMVQPRIREKKNLLLTVSELTHLQDSAKF